MESGRSLSELWSSSFEQLDVSSADPGASYSPSNEASAFDETVIAERDLSHEQTVVFPEGSEEGGPLEAGASGLVVLGEIGRGGMGVVYRARQPSLKRDLAIKTLPSLSVEQERAFVAEALVNGALDHPNILPVYDLLRHAGKPALAMKLIRGRAWSEALSEERPWEAKDPEALREALETLEAILNALEFAHSQGIAHCDLKPANVMIGDFGEVFLMDWGLAVDVSSRGEHRGRGLRRAEDLREPRGTPSYMPPELAEGRGDAIGAWTDLYLVGAILHEVLTGRPPHRGPDLMAVLKAAAASEPSPDLDKAPRELADIARRALRRDPAERYQTAAELRAALRAAQDRGRSREASRAAERRRLDAAEAIARGEGRGELYAELGEATAGFTQALELWQDNDEARAGLEAARLEAADLAESLGDFALARSQVEALPGEHPERGERLELIGQAERARARSQRRQRALRWSLAATLAALVIGAGAAAVIDRGRLATERRLRAEAEGARDEERRARDEERRARESAQAERAKAQAERARARSNLADALREKGVALLKRRDPHGALVFLGESLTIRDDPVVRGRWLQARMRSARRLFAAPWATFADPSPDGSTIALTASDGATLISADDHALLRRIALEGPDKRPDRVMFDASGSALLFLKSSGHVDRVPLTGSEPPREFKTNLNLLMTRRAELTPLADGGFFAATGFVVVGARSANAPSWMLRLFDENGALKVQKDTTRSILAVRYIPEMKACAFVFDKPPYLGYFDAQWRARGLKKVDLGPRAVNERVSALACKRGCFAVGDGVEVLLARPGAARTRLRRHEAYVTELAFSEDARLLASGDLDGVVWVWDEKGAPLLKLQPGPCRPLDANEVEVRSLRFLKGRRLLVAWKSGGVEIWQLPKDPDRGPSLTPQRPQRWMGFTRDKDVFWLLSRDAASEDNRPLILEAWPESETPWTVGLPPSRRGFDKVVAIRGWTGRYSGNGEGAWDLILADVEGRTLERYQPTEALKALGDEAWINPHQLRVNPALDRCLFEPRKLERGEEVSILDVPAATERGRFPKAFFLNFHPSRPRFYQLVGDVSPSWRRKGELTLVERDLDSGEQIRVLKRFPKKGAEADPNLSGFVTADGRWLVLGYTLAGAVYDLESGASRGDWPQKRKAYPDRHINETYLSTGADGELLSQLEARGQMVYSLPQGRELLRIPTRERAATYRSDPGSIKRECDGLVLGRRRFAYLERGGVRLLPMALLRAATGPVERLIADSRSTVGLRVEGFSLTKLERESLAPSWRPRK